MYIEFLTLSLSLVLSLLIFYVEQSAASWTKLQNTPDAHLELESLGWHVGWVKAVSSALEALRDQAGVLIDLDEKQIKAGLSNAKYILPFKAVLETQNPWMKMYASDLHRLMRSIDQ